MIDVPNVLNRAQDDPRLLLSEPFRAVHFVYGLAYPDIPPLNGRALFGALAAIGFSDEAARGILLRLRRGGFIESRRVGREATYRLTPRSTALIEAVALRSAGPSPAWDGTFETLVLHIPSVARAFREQLWRRASYAGFGSPLAGLLIAPYPSSVVLLEPLLAARPPGATVTRGRLTVAPDEAAQLAASAWDLEPVAAALEAEGERMRHAAQAAEARSAHREPLRSSCSGGPSDPTSRSCRRTRRCRPSCSHRIGRSTQPALRSHAWRCSSGGLHGSMSRTSRSPSLAARDRGRFRTCRQRRVALPRRGIEPVRPFTTRASSGPCIVLAMVLVSRLCRTHPGSQP